MDFVLGYGVLGLGVSPFSVHFPRGSFIFIFAFSSFVLVSLLSSHSPSLTSLRGEVFVQSMGMVM